MRPALLLLTLGACRAASFDPGEAQPSRIVQSPYPWYSAYETANLQLLYARTDLDLRLGALCDGVLVIDPYDDQPLRAPLYVHEVQDQGFAFGIRGTSDSPVSPDPVQPDFWTDSSGVAYDLSVRKPIEGLSCDLLVHAPGTPGLFWTTPMATLRNTDASRAWVLELPEDAARPAPLAADTLDGRTLTFRTEGPAFATTAFTFTETAWTGVAGVTPVSGLPTGSGTYTWTRETDLSGTLTLDGTALTVMWWTEETGTWGAADGSDPDRAGAVYFDSPPDLVGEDTGWLDTGEGDTALPDCWATDTEPNDETAVPVWPPTDGSGLFVDGTTDDGTRKGSVDVDRFAVTVAPGCDLEVVLFWTESSSISLSLRLWQAEDGVPVGDALAEDLDLNDSLGFSNSGSTAVQIVADLRADAGTCVDYRLGFILGCP